MKKTRKREVRKWGALKEVKKWKIDNDLTNKMIAEAVGVSGSLVQKTVDGLRRSRPVIDEFVKRGCPREFFGNDKPKAIQ